MRAGRHQAAGLCCWRLGRRSPAACTPQRPPAGSRNAGSSRLSTPPGAAPPVLQRSGSERSPASHPPDLKVTSWVQLIKPGPGREYCGSPFPPEKKHIYTYLSHNYDLLIS